MPLLFTLHRYAVSDVQRRLAQLVQSAALTEQRSAVRARYFLPGHGVQEPQIR